jgi:Mn-containing catalase
MEHSGQVLCRCILCEGETNIRKDNIAKAVFTDIGTEEMAHWEIIATLIFKIIDRADPGELEAVGLGPHYIQHGLDIYPHDAAGAYGHYET